MRLLHVLDALPDGAATAWCRSAGRALAARGHRVEVLGTTPRAGGSTAWGSVDLDGGLRVRRLPPSASLEALARLAGRRAGPWSSRLRGALVRAVLAHDAVHLHGATPPYARLAWLASRVARRPLLVTPHGGTPAAWLCARAEAVVVTAPEEEAALRRAGIAVRRMVTTAHGAPEAPTDPSRDGWREHLGLAAGAPLLVFAGATDWGTGAIPFVDAVRLLRLEGRAAVPVILGEYRAGDGRPRRLWQAGRVPVVELPPLPDGERQGLLAAADAVVLPAGWHLGAAYEAWDAGTPVLAPDDGRPDGAGPGIVTFPLRDPAALAHRLAALLDGPAAAAALVAAGRRRLAAAPRWADVAERMEALYLELTRRRAGGRGSGE